MPSCVPCRISAEAERVIGQKLSGMEAGTSKVRLATRGQDLKVAACRASISTITRNPAAILSACFARPWNAAGTVGCA